MSEPEQRCGLCGEWFGSSKLSRDHGMPKCQYCTKGDLIERLKPTGLQTIVDHETKRHRSGGATLLVHVVVTGRWLYPMHAEFAREGLLDKLVNLFADELEVGDPLFDDAVLIKTMDPAGTARLLRTDGAQSAILELIGLPRGTVRLEGGTLRSTQIVDSHDSPIRDQILAACALARHLQPLPEPS